MCAIDAVYVFIVFSLSCCVVETGNFKDCAIANALFPLLPVNIGHCLSAVS